MITTELQYRYPGVQPFASNQQHIFFGRKEDAENLLSLILQERLCILFGKSGHGKSSLINAGIIPALAEKGIKGKRRFIPIQIRFNIWHPKQPQTLYDKLAFHLYQVFEAEGFTYSTEAIDLPKTIWGAFKRWQFNRNCSFVLLIDQFEEFFSYPLEEQELFKEQLAELLYSDYPQYLQDHEEVLTSSQNLWLAEKIDSKALFSIRADRLSELDRLKDRLPAILLKRFELRALSFVQANEAIVGPARKGAGEENLGLDTFWSPAFSFSTQALKTIITGLIGRTGAEADRIEAFLLQIVCASIEKKVSEQKLSTIENTDLPNFDTVFDDYYQDRIRELSEDERPLAQKVLEHGLLLIDPHTDEVRRISRDVIELIQAFNLTPQLLQNLEQTYLVRREANLLGSFNYEISHDTLILPMLRSRKLQEAIEEASHLETERLEAERRAQEAQEKIAEETRRAEEAERLKKEAEIGRGRARFFARVSTVVAILALGMLGFAIQQQQLARSKQAEAEENARQLKQALALAQKAEEDRQLAESEKVWREVKNILNRATQLESTSPRIARDMRKEALVIIDRYPDNILLKEKRKLIKQ